MKAMILSETLSMEKKSPLAARFKTGDRVGIGWIYSSCGTCRFCASGSENLCENFTATGRNANGGYAEYMTVPEDFAYSIPDIFSDTEAAPLLCAGGVGYRSLRLTNINTLIMKRNMDYILIKCKIGGSNESSRLY